MEDQFRHIGRQQMMLESTDSTNNRAAELAIDPANAGTVVMAAVQSQGRGQYGRVWQSMPGHNVLMSILVFPPVKLRRSAILTAWAAVSIAETVRDATQRQPTIKWPNDVLVGGKKIAGTLIESGVTHSQTHYVVGVGLNVNQTALDFERLELPEATSISEVIGTTQDVAKISQSLIHHFDVLYDTLLNRDLDLLEARWVELLGLTGQYIHSETLGREQIQGWLKELSFDGVVIELVSGQLRRWQPEEIRQLRRV